MQFWYELEIFNLSTFSFFQIRQIQAPILTPPSANLITTFNRPHILLEILNFIISSMSEITPNRVKGVEPEFEYISTRNFKPVKNNRNNIADNKIKTCQKLKPSTFFEY